MFAKSSDTEEGSFFQKETELEESFLYDPSVYEYVGDRCRAGKERNRREKVRGEGVDEEGGRRGSDGGESSEK
jgi:hypothetical protein